MESIKDILSQIQRDQAPKESSDGDQSKLFDTDKLKTNPNKMFGNKHKYISKEYQSYGLRIATQLGDKKRSTMYIKWAKEKPRGVLEQAMSFTADYPSARDKTRIFMWKVKDLEREMRENRGETNAEQKPPQPKPKLSPKLPLRK